jgi:hypothetical protein
LKAREAGLWEWFSSARLRAEHAQGARIELLKTAYRLERESHADLYAVADHAAAKLRTTAPITIYQSQGAQALNASLAYVPGEAHILLEGPVATRLGREELLAVLAHELAHFALWETEGGDLFVAEQVLTAMANHDRARPSHFQSARLFRLYTEIFADRAALFVTGDAAASINALVKLETGIEAVSAENYLRQADEIFKNEEVQAEKLTHPETYIRARALKLWADRAEEANAEITRMMEGPLSLEELDLIGQARLSELTRRLLLELLKPRWFQSSAALTHARLFFEDFAPAGPEHEDAGVFEEIQAAGSRLQDYFCYVLLDFAAIDPELEEAPIAAGLLASERLGCLHRFEELVMKELGATKKRITKLKKERDRILADAARAVASPV